MRRRSGQEQVRIGTRRPIVFKGAILTAALAVVGAMAGVAPSSAAGTTARGTATPWPGETWQPDEVRYGMTVEPDVPVRMNDGATLIANIGYPTDLSTGQRASGIFPVLLTQDPYVAESQPQGFYVARGYINAVVQVRGTVNTFGPGGEALVSDEFGPRQAQDGVALVKW